MTQPMILPIAEHFHSYQGEGRWTGTPMHFIRTAGCSVGQHPEAVTWEIAKDNNFPILKTGNTAYVCHTYDGRPFWCDTDFQKGEWLSVADLIDETWERHICLTGGEPFLLRDKLPELFERAKLKGVQIHVETSGTIAWLPPMPTWITVSPKVNYLKYMIGVADEIKLLVDKDFDYEKVPDDIKQRADVYVQPINNELSIDLDNLERCKNVTRIRPDWKISFQTHKFVNWR
jgi:7-carboxy-7-deazaguanine synthase